MTTVTQERAKLAALGQPLRLRSQWGAIRSYTDTRAVTEPATKQFCHISVTNPGSYRNNDAHARAIEQIGINRFPATGISYNRGIAMDGTRYEFQPIGRRGAHTGAFSGSCTRSGCPFRGDQLTSNNWNVPGRGYVIMQNVNDVVSAGQLDAVARTMAADRLAGFVRRDAKIHGHRCVSDKACPGDKMWALMPKLRTLVDLYVKNGFGTPTPGDDDMPLTETDAALVWNHNIETGKVAGGEDADKLLSQARTFAEIAMANTKDLEAKLAVITAKLQVITDLLEEDATPPA